MNRFRIAALALVVLSGMGSSLPAQFGKIDGHVKGADGKPIAQATVTIVGQAFTTVTNSEGYYFFNNTPVGVYELSASALGFITAGIKGLRVVSNQTTVDDFTLQPGGQPLSTMANTRTLDGVAIGGGRGGSPGGLASGGGGGRGGGRGGAVGGLRAVPAEVQSGGASGPSQPLRLRFQLITPTDNMKLEQDPAIAEVSAALKDLFSFPRYQLLDQAAMAVDYFPGGSGRGSSSTEQKLRGEGYNFRLTVTVDSVTPQGVRISVNLMQETMTKIDVLLRTKVTVSLDHTVVLGSTQPLPNPTQVGSDGRSPPIILVVKPEVRKPD